MIIESAYSLYLIFYENPTKDPRDWEKSYHAEAKRDRGVGISKSLEEFTQYLKTDVRHLAAKSLEAAGRLKPR